MITFIK